MNKPAQFTPGPYELRGPRLLTDSNGVVLADNIGANWPGTIEGQANLFTAAPAMYGALLQVREMLLILADNAGDVPEWNTGGELYELAHTVRTALAQAAGSKP